MIKLFTDFEDITEFAKPQEKENDFFIYCFNNENELVNFVKLIINNSKKCIIKILKKED